jgi:hypothetical protein
MTSTPGARPRKTGARFIPRFAGEAFAHQGLPPSGDGPTARRVTSQVAWKVPPSSVINAELSG